MSIGEDGLGVIDELRGRFECRVGISDHLGVCVVELHVTFSREMFGPDVPASVTFEELRQLTDGVRFVHAVIDAQVSYVVDVARDCLSPRSPRHTAANPVAHRQIAVRQLARFLFAIRSRAGPRVDIMAITCFDLENLNQSSFPT